ncbi:hypothetical protein QI059_00985 [Staphylococcus saprophyticus]|nr:hypothetical protein [Staphylococcus saprophyticus]
MNNTVKDYEKLSEQYNKMIAERNSLIDDLSWYKAKVSRLEQIREIKDNALKGADIKVKTLEQRISKLVSENTRLQNDLFSEQLIQDEADDKIKKLERKNEKLRKANSNGWKQKDKVINKLISNIKSKNNLLSEFSQHIGNKPSSSTYKYFRAKLDNLNITEDK